MLKFLGFLLCLWVITWLKTNPFRRIRRIKKLKNIENVNYVLDKLIRDHPSFDDPRVYSHSCSVINCSKAVTYINCWGSIAIELLKPIDFNRRMDIYCLHHANEILNSLKETVSIEDFNKAIEEAKTFKDVITNR